MKIINRLIILSCFTSCISLSNEQIIKYEQLKNSISILQKFQWVSLNEDNYSDVIEFHNLIYERSDSINVDAYFMTEVNNNLKFLGILKAVILIKKDSLKINYPDSYFESEIISIDSHKLILKKLDKESEKTEVVTYYSRKKTLKID